VRKNGARIALRRPVPGPAFQAEAIKAAAGMVQFVLVARALGAEDYGRWVAISLFVALLLPIVTWGANSTFLRAVARSGSSYALELRVARLSLLCGAVAAIVAAVVGPHVLPYVDAGTVAAVTFAEVGLLNLLALRALLAQGEGRFSSYRNRSMYVAAVRLIASVVYVVAFADTGIRGWALVYLVVSSLAAAPWILRCAVRARTATAPVPARDAWLFVLTTVSLRLYDDADKYVLTRAASLSEAGVYAAAYRLVSYVLVPVRGVLAQSYPAMLALGPDDPSGVWRTAVAAARRSTFVGCVAALPLAAAAALLPSVAGDAYRGSAVLVLALSPALSLRGAHYAFADVLTVLGRQRVRAAAQVASFALPVGAYLWLIPLWGAWGAVAATALGEIVTVSVMAAVGRRAVVATGVRLP
jgi:O-antigen/teichoic acid export membrane protein